MNYKTKLIKTLKDSHIIFLFFYNYQHQGHEFFFLPKYVIFPCMPTDETIRMLQLV